MSFILRAHRLPATESHPMSLARKLALRIAALLIGLLLLGGASLWGLIGLSGYFNVAEDEYDQLRAVYAVGNHAVAARLLINVHSVGDPDRNAIMDELNAALGQARTLHDDRYPQPIAKMLEHLQTVAEKTARQTDLRPEVTSINIALGQVAELAARLRAAIVNNRRAATAHLQYTLVIIVAFTTLIMCIGVWIGVAQYRSVMHPLRRLEMAVRRAAAADFTSQVPVEGDREFAQLAAQFNRMADQLDALYRDLESQVAVRSRQLVQSERLASVGYLAAGLAHEINNPLGIICGYAEAALARLDQSAEAHDPETMARAGRALRIICEEAFRCRDITSELLSLARPGRQDPGRREPVDLVPVARRVVDLMSGLPQFKQHHLKLHAPGVPLIAEACEGEIVQVLINLVANALEAVDPGLGCVDVKLRRDDEWVIVQIIDNGRGMSPDVVARVFEPFFTDKPQRDMRGTGLGLSVAHAIVDQHGGRLTATSAGEGLGSTFTVQLPVPVGVASHV